MTDREALEAIRDVLRTAWDEKVNGTIEMLMHLAEVCDNVEDILRKVDLPVEVN